MQYRTREYTAQILKPVINSVGKPTWQLVKNTTFKVADFQPPSRFETDMAHFRAGLRYGGMVTPPGKQFPWWGSGA